MFFGMGQIFKLISTYFVYIFCSVSQLLFLQKLIGNVANSFLLTSNERILYYYITMDTTSHLIKYNNL